MLKNTVATVLAISLLISVCEGFSLDDLQKAKRFSHQTTVVQDLMVGSNHRSNSIPNMATTRRDPIRMPSGTPMVPYKVRYHFSSLAYRWYIICTAS